MSPTWSSLMPTCLVDETVYVYYGGGDHVIGLATCQLDDLLGFVLDD